MSKIQLHTVRLHDAHTPSRMCDMHATRWIGRDTVIAEGMYTSRLNQYHSVLLDAVDNSAFGH